MSSVLHSKSMEYWHLPAKDFTLLLDSNLPSIYTQKLIPVPRALKPPQAGNEHSKDAKMKTKSYPHTVKQLQGTPAP